MKTIDLEPFSVENISIERFISLTQKEKENIASVEIVPPSLGSLEEEEGAGDFGSILIRYKSPVYQLG